MISNRAEVKERVARFNQALNPKKQEPVKLEPEPVSVPPEGIDPPDPEPPPPERDPEGPRPRDFLGGIFHHVRKR